VLQNPDFPSNFAFATINALLKTALNGLMPWKQLAERLFADMYRIMLLWVAYSERPILALGYGEQDFGNQYMIQYSKEGQKDFNPDYLYLETELTADMAVDKVEQANVGSILFNQLDYPLEEVMRQMGETDPQKLIRDRNKEEMSRNEVENIIKMSAAMTDIKIMGLQTKVMQDLAQQAQPPPGAVPPGGAPPGGPPPEGQFAAMQGGNNFNPAMRGLPPAMGAPTQTREAVTLQDATGEGLAV
jgi:hypothetical protein